jgi:hypothetical protein
MTFTSNHRTRRNGLAAGVLLRWFVEFLSLSGGIIKDRVAKIPTTPVLASTDSKQDPPEYQNEC